MKQSRTGVLLLAGALVAFGPLMSDRAVAQEAPTRVILMIADGAGSSYWTAAAFAADRLAVGQFPVGGLVRTHSWDSKITDSAASATAYSAGVKTFNGALSVTPDSSSATTVLEMARDRGMATGLVATSSITHATPAAFAVHVPDRGMTWEIARQIAEAEVDVALGGGRRYFDPEQRPDARDLLGEIRAGHTYVETEAELAGLSTEGVDRLFGLFAEAHLPAAPTRSPTLPAMTRAALEVLDHDPDGFFLMVEGSQPDWQGHDNAPIDGIVAEMLDFDAAVGVALEYQSRHPETLIVVTADHETGGLAIQQMGAARLLTRVAEAADSTLARLAEAGRFSDPELSTVADSASMYMDRLSRLLRREARTTEDTPVLVARYTTGSHTAQMVPLFASGPGADRFGGMIDNTDLGKLLMEIVGR